MMPDSDAMSALEKMIDMASMHWDVNKVVEQKRSIDAVVLTVVALTIILDGIREVKNTQGSPRHGNGESRHTSQEDIEGKRLKHYIYI